MDFIGGVEKREIGADEKEGLYVKQTFFLLK